MSPKTFGKSKNPFRGCFPPGLFSNADSEIGQKWTIRVTESPLMWRTTAVGPPEKTSEGNPTVWKALVPNTRGSREEGQCQGALQRSHWQLWAESSEEKWVTHYIQKTSNCKTMCRCFVEHSESRQRVNREELWQKTCSVHPQTGSLVSLTSHLTGTEMKEKLSSCLLLIVKFIHMHPRR